MNSDKGADAKQFTSIGSYTPPEAHRLLDALSRAKIKFEIACDDGARFAPTKMGYFGQLAKVRVFVNRDQLPDATKIQLGLFGE